MTRLLEDFRAGYPRLFSSLKILAGNIVGLVLALLIANVYSWLSG